MLEQERKRYRAARIRDGLVYWLYIPAAVLLGGKLLDLAFGLPRLPEKNWLLAVAVMLLLAGGFVIQLATRDLQRLGDGTPNPRFPTRQLVTGGIYAWCRHPMFFGYHLASLGVVLLFRSPGMLLVAWPIFLQLQVRFLRREEKILQKRFGALFDAYRRQVPLLLPRPPAKGKMS